MPGPTQGYYTQPSPYAQPQPAGGTGYAIAGMILGILSIVFMCAWFLSIPTGLLGITFGYLGLKTSARGMATAGLVCGIIGLAFNALWILIFASMMAAGSTAPH